MANEGVNDEVLGDTPEQEGSLRGRNTTALEPGADHPLRISPTRHPPEHCRNDSGYQEQEQPHGKPLMVRGLPGLHEPQ